MDINNRKRNLIKKYLSSFKAAEKKGVSQNDIRNIFYKSLKAGHSETKRFEYTDGDNVKLGAIKKGHILKKYIFTVLFVLGIISSATVYNYKEPLNELFRIDAWLCLIENNGIVSELAKPLIQCDFCRTLEYVPIEDVISVEDFRRKYAYDSVPVLIKGATLNWSAMSDFSYEFLKDLYTETEGALMSVEEECQFFQYNTEFNSLSEVFNMSDARANLSEGYTSWYIGWSNCHNDVKKELRNHYERPYFLPNDSESSTLDWIFMGGSGPGALVHLDYVQRPSWQAQISGTKTWTLIPPPECETECKAFNVTVYKGDINTIH